MADTITIEPTRECCQSLYFQGLHYSKISQQTGVKPATIRTWILRYGWDTIRDKLKGNVEQKVTAPILTTSVEKASNRVREHLSKELEQACEQLAKVKQGRSVPKLRARQEVLTRVVQCANKVFGWDQQSSSTVASVQSLSSDLPTPGPTITAKLSTPTEEIATPNDPVAQLPMVTTQ